MCHPKTWPVSRGSQPQQASGCFRSASRVEFSPFSPPREEESYHCARLLGSRVGISFPESHALGQSSKALPGCQRERPHCRLRFSVLSGPSPLGRSTGAPGSILWVGGLGLLPGMASCDAVRSPCAQPTRHSCRPQGEEPTAPSAS